MLNSVSAPVRRRLSASDRRRQLVSIGLAKIVETPIQDLSLDDVAAEAGISRGLLFHYFPTGTSKTPSELTDTVMLCQGQRGILEWRFAHPGKYMFHAHQSEFTELGWQGFFEVA